MTQFNETLKGTKMKNGKLNGKIAVVTGASKGIGAGIAKEFAAEGAAVVVNYASSKEGADQVVNDITVLGGKAIAVQGDVAKTEDIEHLFAEASKAFGRLDILINNAGVYRLRPSKKLLRMSFIGNSIPTCWVSFWQRAKQ